MVPVLGAGFNAQARKSLGWRDLLVRVANDLGLGFEVPPGEEIVGNTTLVWEAMLAEVAGRSSQSPYLVERALERHVRAVLAHEYPPGGATRELAQRLASARFRDVISFNFDLGFHVVPPRWARREAGRYDPVRDHALHGSGARVWYPHGSVSDAASLQLGMRKYGLLIRRLELARRAHKRAGRTAEKGRGPDLVPGSWVDVAMGSPLVFLGLSLGREEWALWWFLNQRRRNLARTTGGERGRGHRLAAFVLVQESERARLTTPAGLAGLTLLSFPDGAFDPAWERVLSALGCDASRESAAGELPAGELPAGPPVPSGR